MGIYRHLSDAELAAMRDRLLASLQQRLTAPTSASNNGRNVQYQQSAKDIRKELEQVIEEIDSRAGHCARRPIYLV